MDKQAEVLEIFRNSNTKFRIFGGSRGGYKSWITAQMYWAHEVTQELWFYDWAYEDALVKAGLL